MQRDQEGVGDASIRRFEAVASTNDEACAWARHDAPHLGFVVASQQTGGRGRRGRSWASPAGLGFYGSLIVRPRAEAEAQAGTSTEAREGVGTALSLARWTLGAAVGITNALDELGLRAQVKWPNDVLLNNKKVAGVLCEAEWAGGLPAFLVVGVGVNVSHRHEDLPERPLFPASSLLLESGERFEPERVERALVCGLRAVAREIGGGGWNIVRAQWEERCVGRGELISVTGESGEGSGKYFGVLRGLDESGALLVATADGTRRVVTGDVAFE